MSSVRTPFSFVTNPALLVHSEDELRLHALFSCMGLRPEEESLALRHITIIGAEAINFNQAYENIDSARLSLLLRYLMDSGIPVHPHFTVDAVDFRHDRDFLDETGKTDLVYVSYIRGEPAQDSKPYNAAFKTALVRKSEEDRAHDIRHAQSPLATQDGWRIRLENSGAKIFASHGGKREVGTSHVARGHPDDVFQTLIPTPDIYDNHLPHARYETLDYLYHQKGLDAPTTWLGLAVRQHYARTVLKIIRKPETFLGRHMQERFDPRLPKQAKPHWLRSIFPKVRAMLESQGYYVGLGRAQGKQADTKGHPGPHYSVHP